MDYKIILMVLYLYVIACIIMCKAMIDRCDSKMLLKQINGLGYSTRIINLNHYCFYQPRSKEVDENSTGADITYILQTNKTYYYYIVITIMNFLYKYNCYLDYCNHCQTRRSVYDESGTDEMNSSNKIFIINLVSYSFTQCKAIIKCYIIMYT